jgi:putative transposase
MTPASVHQGEAEKRIGDRQSVLDAAYQAHPERFVKQPPQHPSLPEAVWINPPAGKQDKTP